MSFFAAYTDQLTGLTHSPGNYSCSIPYLSPFHSLCSIPVYMSTDPQTGLVQHAHPQHHGSRRRTVGKPETLVSHMTEPVVTHVTWGCNSRSHVRTCCCAVVMLVLTIADTVTGLSVPAAVPEASRASKRPGPTFGRVWTQS